MGDFWAVFDLVNNSFQKNPRKVFLAKQILHLLRYRSNWQILHNRIISSFVLSSDNTNYKNDIQLFLQLFDELSVYRDYH